MAKKKIPERYQPWVEARERFRLSDAHIQMAQELGLNPKNFGGLANTRQKPWKAPPSEFIEELYFRHFENNRPENVRSIEQMVLGQHLPQQFIFAGLPPQSPANSRTSGPGIGRIVSSAQEVPSAHRK